MGINGLLQALKPIAKQVHVRQYQGHRVAVDGYSWLHKGAYCCARELCEGIWTDRFVVYFLSRIQLLRSNGLEPIVVFDGGRLPIKGEEEDSRRRARAEARDKAAAHMAAGNVAMAVECYQRCVDITPAMAKQVIEELKSQGVAFLVAPYEADAQMAYLARSGQVQLVITEDSDLLAYGCPRVLYKLDKTGMGEELSLTDLPHCATLPLSGWTSDQFLQLCVMAGCDFLTQLPGIGLKKAHGVLRKYRSFTKVVKMLRFNGTKVPPDYETRFQLALWAFRHARVYCTTEKAMVHLAPLPGGGIGAADVDVPAAVAHLEQQQQDQKLDFLGPVLPPDIAKGIAEGELDPNNHKPFDLAAIYAGCKRPPAHLAAQLTQLQPTSAPGAVEQPWGSGMAARSGGPAAAGKPRVGLSKRHVGQSQGANRRMSAAGAGSSSRNPGGGQQGAGSGGGRRRVSTLGIAKYFQRPAAAAAETAGAAAPAAAAQGIKQSIAQAINTLGKQMQQRQQQQHEEKQQLLQQLNEQCQLQQQQGVLADADDSEPRAKRQRSSADPAAEAATILTASDGCDFGDAEAAAVPALLPSLDPSLPSSGPLGLTAPSQSPAVGSMSLGLGYSASGLAGSSSGLADAGPCSQANMMGASSLDASLPGSSSQGVFGSQSLRPRGAAVSALTALFGGSAGAAAGWGSSQQLFDAPTAGPVDAASAWTTQLDGGSGSGAFPSQRVDLGGSGLLGSSSDLVCSIGGSMGGSTNSLSFGSLAGADDAAAGACLDGAVSLSFAGAQTQAMDMQGAAAGGNGTQSFLRLQQCLRGGLQLPPQQQQQAAAHKPGGSSFFSQQQPHSTARRHSRFREQLLQASAAEIPDTQSPEDLGPGMDAVLGSQGADELAQHQEQLPLGGHGAQQQQLDRAQAAAGAVMGSSAQQQLQTQLPTDSSDPSSDSTSNDENAEAEAALAEVGITHVRQFAKLAHRAVKAVAKQQSAAGVLHTQLQSPPQLGKQPLQATQRQNIAAGQAAVQPAPALADKARLQLGLNKRGLQHSRKGPKGRGATAGAGSFAAKLAELRYDASMFVTLEQHEQQRVQQQPLQPPQQQQDALGDDAGQQFRGLFGHAGTTAAARKPFKAPRVAAGSSSQAAAAAADSPGMSFLEEDEGQRGAGAMGFGAFGSFACAGV